MPERDNDAAAAAADRKIDIELRRLAREFFLDLLEVIDVEGAAALMDAIQTGIELGMADAAAEALPPTEFWKPK